jgi:hypothetical protein
MLRGGQDADLRAGGQHPAGQPGRGGHQVLAVVQDQQGPAVSQRGEQAAERVGRLFGRRPGRTACVEERLFAQAERGQRGGQDLGRVADRGQLDQPHPIGRAVVKGALEVGGGSVRSSRCSADSSADGSAPSWSARRFLVCS